MFGSPSPQKKELELSDDVRVGDISVAGGGEEEDGQQHVRIVESVNKLLADAQVLLFCKWENKCYNNYFLEHEGRAGQDGEGEERGTGRRGGRRWWGGKSGRGKISFLFY